MLVLYDIFVHCLKLQALAFSKNYRIIILWQMLAKPALSLVSKGPLSSLGTAPGENAQIATKNAHSRKSVHTSQPCIHVPYFKGQIYSGVLALSKWGLWSTWIKISYSLGRIACAVRESDAGTSRNHQTAMKIGWCHICIRVWREGLEFTY